MKTQNSSNKIFIIVIALLLIANMVTLTILLTENNSDNDDRKISMRNYLKSEIGFSDAQLMAFDTVKSKHKEKAKLLYDEIRLHKQNNLRSIGATNFNDSSIQSAANYAASQQQYLEINMLNHLKEIRNLCTPGQRAIFDTGFYKIMTRSSSNLKKKD